MSPSETDGTGEELPHEPPSHTLCWEPEPRSTALLVRLLRGLWTLPTNLLGYAAGALVSGNLGRPVRSPYARGRVFRIRLPFLHGIGAVTLGNAILVAPAYGEGRLGRLVLAHELAHTRQHDVLGPFYLPLHILFQGVSVVQWLRRPVPGSTPVHAYNPLEQRWLFMGHGSIPPLLAADPSPECEGMLQRLGV